MTVPTNNSEPYIKTAGGALWFMGAVTATIAGVVFGVPYLINTLRGNETVVAERVAPSAPDASRTTPVVAYGPAAH